MSYSFIDLFAGAGGWALGFQAAGFSHIGMYDWNEAACRTARANFGDVVHHADLSRHERTPFPCADVVVGSPPCQGFSNEGYKDRNDPRNDLLWSFLEIVDRVKPRAWVLENVPGLQRSYEGHYFAKLERRLREGAYRWKAQILDSANYGVPQRRERFVLVALRGAEPRLPPGTHTEQGDLASDPFVTLWDAIGDLPVPRLGDRIGMYEYDKEPFSEYQRECRSLSRVVLNHTAQNHSQRVLEKIAAVPQGGDMSHLVKRFAENRVHYMGGYRRALKHRPSWTAYWTRGMTSIHPDQNRFLTPRECARIQSFPDWFEFRGTTIENYTQVCNAVPPMLARAIGATLLDQLRELDECAAQDRKRVVTPRPRRSTAR